MIQTNVSLIQKYEKIENNQNIPICFHNNTASNNKKDKENVLHIRYLTYKD